MDITIGHGGKQCAPVADRRAYGAATLLACLLALPAHGLQAAEVVECGSLAPVAGRACAVTAGSDGSVLLQGDVLAPGTIFRGGGVLVEADGDIGCVGCGCDAPMATVVRCPEAVVSPGLVNAMDHITFSNNSPAADTGERYEQRHDWRRGQRGHTQLSVTGGASGDQLRWAELRQVISGTTSVSGSGGTVGLLRNLDNATNQGLGLPTQRRDTFPLGDSAGTQLAVGCGYPDIVTPAEIAAFPAWLATIGEGIDEAARNEVRCLSGQGTGAQDVILPQTVVGKGVALDSADFARLRNAGAGIAWTPRSNLRLYGDTVRVTAATGVRIALGTDWIPTGSMNMLRELACADDFDREYLDRRIGAERLWEMATRNGAINAAVGERIGSIAIGQAADLAVFATTGGIDHDAILTAQPADVLLTMRGGRVLYGEAATVAEIPGSGACDALSVCGAARAACIAGEVGQTVSQLETAVGTGAYPLFFCGLPDGEPTCAPARTVSIEGGTVYTGELTAGDLDGDGIANALDNCPTVFNPARPGDAGMQADSNGNGLGDECEPVDDRVFQDGFEPTIMIR